jgi:hypothetical protein
MYLPLHFFLSYSREDEPAVDRLCNDLHENDIPMWIDKSGLVPGSPNWERALRNALSHSYGIVLCASPAASDSTFVQAELGYAGSIGLPIIPVWIRGDYWSHSAPMSVSQTQYVDLRPDHYEKNLRRLVTRLSELEKERKPRHVLLDDAFHSGRERDELAYGLGFGADSYIVVQLDQPAKDTGREQRAALFNPAAYESLQELLDDLYSLHLSDRFEPLEYGSRWLLSEKESRSRQIRRFENMIFAINPKRLIAPWEWLGFAHAAATSQIQPYWARSPLHYYGVTPGSVWYVLEPERPRSGHFDETARRSAFGIAVNNDELLREIFEGAGKQPHPPHRAGFLEVVAYDSINKQAFRHLAIALDEWNLRPFAGKVLKETDKTFDPKLFIHD